MKFEFNSDSEFRIRILLSVSNCRQAVTGKRNANDGRPTVLTNTEEDAWKMRAVELHNNETVTDVLQ